MRSATFWLALMAMAFAMGMTGRDAKAETRQAVIAIVSGDRIQKVGFRAMVQKLAIQQNLAGFVRNGMDSTVEVRLEGPKARIDEVIAAMRRGTGKSSRDNAIQQAQTELTAGLATFTIYGWTSASRNIETPYDLVFHLRSGDRPISRKSAKHAWNVIALATLKGDDLAKFKQRLAAEE